MKSTNTTYHGFTLEATLNGYYILRINVYVSGVMIHHYEVYRRKGRNFILEFQSDHINDDAFNECIKFVRTK
jgi:hypothetical protein